MNIHFDFDLLPEDKKVVLEPTAFALTNEIKKLVVEKLSVFSTEIDKEEAQASNAIMTIITMGGNLRVGFAGYSADLSVKMNNSLLGIGKELELRLNDANARTNN